MQQPAIPTNEDERLQALRDLQLLDTAAEQDFDDMVELASFICEVPISLFTLVDSKRQWFKANKGLDVDYTSREISFCGHAINEEEILTVVDTSKDQRFFDNPLVTSGPKIGFYAGIPIKTSNGLNIGTLCVIDKKPKVLTDEQLEKLKLLGKQMVKLIELREKSHELKRKNAKLENLNEINNKITSIISHDLKGPIGSIQSYLESGLIDESNPQEISQAFGLIKSNIGSLNTLVENLLEWSMSNGESVDNEINLFNLVEDLFSLYHSNAVHKNNVLLNKVAPDLTVRTDASMLRFIIRNLIHNAIKFTESGEISIFVEISNGNIEIHISDTGSGVKAEILERMKVKDRKVTTTGTRKEKGTGLGIQLIQEFLSRIGTPLLIKTEVGKGSVFSFTIPQ